jgi:serine protease inhibitor
MGLQANQRSYQTGPKQERSNHKQLVCCKCASDDQLPVIRWYFFVSRDYSFTGSFLAKWQHEFQGQHTQDGNTFYPDKGAPQEKKLTLMMQNGMFPYVDLTLEIGARMIHLPFTNKDLTFTIILPNKDVKLSQVESNLTSAIFNSPTTTKQNIFVWIPKWKFEFESKLENVLKNQMKVNDLFDPNKANLKGLSTAKKIYLSNFIHKYVQ